MSTELAILLLLGGFGLAGGFMIGRQSSTPRTLGAFALWLPVPFVIAAVVLSAQRDPTLTDAQASYNFAFAFAIVSFAMVVPWFVANLVGWLVGRRFRRTVRASTPVAGPVDPGLPDWSVPDVPLLSLEHLGQRMRGIAARSGIADELLPSLGEPTDGEGAYLYCGKTGYIYTALERGHRSFERDSVVADEILYRVFCDRAFAQSVAYMAEHHLGAPDYGSMLAERQEAVLTAIDARWGRRFAVDRNSGGGPS